MALVFQRSNDASRCAAGMAGALGATMAIGCLVSASEAQTTALWGRNLEGQCTVPSGLGEVQSLSGGLYHSAALRTDGSLAC